MGFGRAFLSLCLLVCTQANKVIPLSPWRVKTLSGATADGSAVYIPDMNWDKYTDFPRTHWYVSAWVQIHPATADTARLLQFKGFSGAVPVMCYVTWTSSSAPTFTFGVTDHTVSGYPDSRKESVWFYLVMGTNSGLSFGYITFRSASSNQFSVQWSETITADYESSLMAPASANPFNVSSM